MARPLLYFLFISFLALQSCGIKRSMQEKPQVGGIEAIDTLRTRHNDSLFTIGKNSLSKNEFGIWELYVEGAALERGLVNGSLTRELMHKQERAIMNKIETLVPSTGYRNFLSSVVAWFNRKMYQYVPEEYKQEIYGISRFALPQYNDFAPPYERSLYLHGAHDIGHALQDLMLVGCTSFAAWDSKTEDGQLLLGRNFDFYAGDEFAEEKIAAFINPVKGHKFMMYTWGGMIGTVSGMNEKGLTVTINAGRSKIPLLAKTPVSLIAREILQYAETTAEAIEIARKREVFVSESIMIGAAAERKTILIEVSPRNFGVYDVTNSNQLICSNHFLSKPYAEDPKNKQAIKESHTAYRYKRMEELVASKEQLNPLKAAEILRNKDGLENINIGLGNEKAINQLHAHHGIIFKPEEKKVWISANPYQMGKFISYNLEKAFEEFTKGNRGKSVVTSSEIIPEDPFIHSPAYKKYEEFRTLKNEVSRAIIEGTNLQEEKLQHFLNLNPHYWKGYSLVGNYYYNQKDYRKAIINYKQALQREVSTVPNEEFILKRIRKSYRKL